MAGTNQLGPLGLVQPLDGRYAETDSLTQVSVALKKHTGPVGKGFEMRLGTRGSVSDGSSACRIVACHVEVVWRKCMGEEVLEVLGCCQLGCSRIASIPSMS